MVLVVSLFVRIFNTTCRMNVENYIIGICGRKEMFFLIMHIFYIYMALHIFRRLR